MESRTPILNVFQLPQLIKKKIMTQNLTKASLKAAHKHHEIAMATLEKIQTAINSKPLTDWDHSAFEKARLDLEDCLARRKLGEAMDEEEIQARSAFDAAEHNFNICKRKDDAANLEMVGLNRRLLSAQAEEEATKQRLVEAEGAWILEKLQLADQAYTELAIKLSREYLRVGECLKALLQRRIDAPLAVHNSDAIAIPSIGPVSCKVLIEKTLSCRDGIGGLMFKGTRHSNQCDSDTGIERELQDIFAATLKQ